jgi:hypothetical protein
MRGIKKASMHAGSLGPSMHITSLCHSRRADAPFGRLAYLPRSGEMRDRSGLSCIDQIPSISVHAGFDRRDKRKTHKGT